MRKIIIKYIVGLIALIVVGCLCIIVGNLYIVLNRHVFNSYYGIVDIDTAKTLSQDFRWGDDYYRIKSVDYDSLYIKNDTIKKLLGKDSVDVYVQPWKGVYLFVIEDTAKTHHVFTIDPYTNYYYGEIVTKRGK